MATIQFFNTPARQKQTFGPITPGKVNLYTCGPTVYNTQHVGNFVAYVRWDTLVRMLQASGLEVIRVMNITDVGHLASDADEGIDKMAKGAEREGISMQEVAERYTAEFMKDFNALGMMQPTFITKATDYIEEQIALIKTLEAKHYTYAIDDGVYFDTAKFPRYAEFAQLDIAGLKAGARVDYNSEKRHTSDFALWKFDTTAARTEMVWDSPWGRGFPGWHLECSAMIKAKLGNTIDIHTGGIDHIPVHHTNEIAQSEAANSAPLAHYWLHGAHLLSNGTKISKSLGNGYTLTQIAEEDFSPMDVRMFVLQSHYRTESNFTWENLEAAANRLIKWRSVAALRWQTIDTSPQENASTDDLTVAIIEAQQAILAALQDDLDTPTALRIIDELFAKIEAQGLADVHEQPFKKFLQVVDELLGLQLIETSLDISAQQKQLIAEREAARAQKNWAKADEAREALAQAGIGLRDTSSGAIWYFE